MNLITLCPRCAQKMRSPLRLREASMPYTGLCKCCWSGRATTVQQYEMYANRKPRRPQSGPPPRDRRARYREPFRGEAVGGVIDRQREAQMQSPA